jgi:hypothetical protein
MESARTAMAHAAAAADVPTVRPRAAGDGDDGGDGEGEARRLWAELERMPTPQRARSAIVTLEEGEKEGAGRKAVVDVGRLGPGQRRALLDRLVGSADRDNERFLRELRERIDRYVYALARAGIVDHLAVLPFQRGRRESVRCRTCSGAVPWD